MSTHATDDGREEASLPVPADGTVEVVAEVVTASGRPAECTLYPADASGMELMTTWMTAREGSFVRCDEMR
ncbi:MAG: transcriptional regulator [Halorientalis sp.]